MAIMLCLEMRRKLLLGTLHFVAAQSAKLLVFMRALDAKVPTFGFEVHVKLPGSKSHQGRKDL